ncbi:MAG: hypothetical protein P9M08_09775 [Candidatus Erginobacter occultus]|nr:hypothetical protein [Candidatus Erginobacter occultus]
MTEIANLETLPAAVADKVKPYLEKMIEIQGDNLLSAAVYGSAAGEDFSEKISDINILLVCREVDLPALKKSLDLVARGNRSRIPAPLFLTPRYLKTSADVFPVEFFEIKDHCRVLYGEDFISGLKIDRKNLRHQCEEQVKGKLVRIREAYLETAGKKGGLDRILKESLASLMPVFRNLPRLQGKEPAGSKEEVLNSLAREFGLEAEVFLSIWRDRQDDEKIGGENAEIYLERYLRQLEKLAAAVDEL